MELPYIANKSLLFWIIFAGAGILVFVRFPFGEIVIGIMVIAVGIYTLGRELEEQRQVEERAQLKDTLIQIQDWLQSEHAYVKNLESKYENRFFQTNKKRISIEKKLEKQQRDVIKKILDLDNRLMEVARAFTTAKPRSGRKRK